VERSASGAIRIGITTRASTTCKNIDVEIPRDRFTVITGVSGSGKSTLAFDILFAEGQRRYLESLNAYARQFVQPRRARCRRDLRHSADGRDRAAHEPRRAQEHRRHAHRDLSLPALLFVKLGTQHCPDCNVPIEPQSEDAIAAR
jgi:excinuclease ABC subunit A